MIKRNFVERAARLGLLMVAVLVFICPQTSLWAQVDRGTIVGTVADTIGAVVPGVHVTATNVATNTAYIAESNALGIYNVLNLPIGIYVVSFNKSGFKTLSQSGVEIEAGHTIEINPRLDVGSVVETVNVTATPILELQTEVGSNMSNAEIAALPAWTGGGPRDIIGFAFDTAPNVAGSAWTASINGSQNWTDNVMIDGTSMDSGLEGDTAEASPSMDAVEQVQVDSNGLRAEESRSGGGTFMVVLKSGTNKWHASAYDFLTNEALNANTWTNKWFLSQCGDSATCPNGEPSSAYARARHRSDNYGYSGGGPIWKNRAFIFGSYEMFANTDWRFAQNATNAPTANMLTGNFSELLPYAASGQGSSVCPSSPCPIMNTSTNTPYTDAAGNAIYYGSVFLPNGQVAPGNVIPSQYWGTSAISQKLLAIYNQPMYQPTTTGVVNNFPRPLAGQPSNHVHEASVKFDENISKNDQFASSWIFNYRPRLDSNSGSLWAKNSQNPGPLTQGTLQLTDTDSYRFSETHTFTPNLLNVASYTFNMFQNIQNDTPENQGPWAANLGLQNGAVKDTTPIFPQIDYGGGIEGPIGGSQTGGYVSYQGMLNEAFSWNKGRHAFKFGAEIRSIGFNSNGGPTGAYQIHFSPGTFAPVSNEAVAPWVGSGFANMGMGYVASASQNIPVNYYTRRKEYGFFAQDDYKITTKLTIDLDLRWDITGPLHELHGQWANFSTTAHDPNFGSLPGAYVWLANKHDSFETISDYHQFGPHVGFAYQLSPKSVLRSSYALMYTPITNNTWNGIPFGAQPGYQANDVVGAVPHSASGQGVPAYQWDSGYPGIATKPSGPMPNQGYVQWGVGNINPHSRQLGFTQNLSLGYEYEVRHDMKVDVTYSGAFGRNLHDAYGSQLNAMPWAKYQKLLMSDPAQVNINTWVDSQATAQAAGVTLPYQGWGYYAWGTLVPFPQVLSGNGFGGPVGESQPPIGRSGYNGLGVEVKKRAANGLALDVSWNKSRQTGNVSDAFNESLNYNGGYDLYGDNIQDPETYNSRSNWAVPLTQEVVKGYVAYALPVGRGQRFLAGNSRLVESFVSGWSLSTLVGYGNGAQLEALYSTNSYPGWFSSVYANVKTGANFKNHFKTWNPAWQPGTGSDPNSLFFDPTNFSDPNYGSLGNSPKYYPNLRQWATPTESGTIQKKFNVGPGERYHAILRADFFDIFNRHQWDSPNHYLDTPGLGHVQGENGTSRTGQIEGRIEF